MWSPEGDGHPGPLKAWEGCRIEVSGQCKSTGIKVNRGLDADQPIPKHKLPTEQTDTPYKIIDRLHHGSNYVTWESPLPPAPWASTGPSRVGSSCSQLAGRISVLGLNVRAYSRIFIYHVGSWSKIMIRILSIGWYSIYTYIIKTIAYGVLDLAIFLLSNLF